MPDCVVATFKTNTVVGDEATSPSAEVFDMEYFEDVGSMHDVVRPTLEYQYGMVEDLRCHPTRYRDPVYEATCDEVTDAVNALNETISYLENARDQIKHADDEGVPFNEIRRAYSMLRNYNDGDRPEHTAVWAELRLKDMFRRTDNWDEDQRWPVPDDNPSETNGW